MHESRDSRFPCGSVAPLLLGVFLLLLSGSGAAEDWSSIGPEGGSFIGAVTDSRNASTAIAITADPSVSYVFRTDDGGGTWAKIGTIPENALVDMCAFDIDTLYVHTSRGCYASKDGGVTWTYSQWSSASAYAYCMCAHPTNAQKVYAAGSMPGQVGAMLYQSSDGGQSWSATHTGIEIDCCDIAVAESHPNVIFMVGYKWSMTAFGLGAIRSIDGGTTWKDISRAVETTPFYSASSVAIDPTDPLKVYIGGWRFYRSTNGGVSWTKDSANYYDIQSIGIDPVTPSNVYLGDDDCVWVSRDFGRTVTQYTGCIFGDVEHIEVAPARPSTVYAAASRGGLFKTDDSGVSWNPSHGGIHATNITALDVTPSRPETLYMDIYSAYTLMASRDSGASWSPVTYPAGCSGTLRELMVSSADPDTVLALEPG